MDWYNKAIYKIAQVQHLSPQEANDRGLFGPVYHGTTPENRAMIDQEGFRLFEGEARQGPVSQGYENQPYGNEGIPPPVHHLGFGIYFTTNKMNAKNFSGGTTRGMKTYYLDIPNHATINFGTEKNMMRWWIKNGYDPELAKSDRVTATRLLTQNLSSQYDAVWYKGKGLRRLLDGDQICVYDPSRIYEIDISLANPGDIGSRVKRKSDGMIGTILDVKDATDFQYFWAKKNPGKPHPWLKPETTKIFSVKWRKGGTDGNINDVDVEVL